MIKLIKWLFISLIIGALTVTYLASSKPNWVSLDNEVPLNQRVVNSMSGDNLKKLLSSNLTSLLSFGQLDLSEEELTTLLYGALATDRHGQKLIVHSADIQAKIFPDSNQIEIGALINTNNLAKLAHSASQQKNIEQWLERYSFFKDKNVYLGVKGLPKAIDNKIGIEKNTKMMLGKLPIPLFILSLLGLDTERLDEVLIDVQYADVKKIIIEDRQLKLSIKPRF